MHHVSEGIVAVARFWILLTIEIFIAGPCDKGEPRSAASLGGRYELVESSWDHTRTMRGYFAFVLIQI